jgi:peptidyl-prolyl cis-trans isomerase A (cyclophilin A)
MQVMRANLFAAVALVAFAGACEKKKTDAPAINPSPSPTTPSPAAPANPPAGQGEGTVHNDQTAPSGDLPPEPVKPGPNPAPAGDSVRAPKADDLAEYTKDIAGKGPLMATIDTSMGAFHCQLYGDKAPATVANFVGLATGKKPWLNPKTSSVEKGKPYYDGLVFHRVIPQFMIQGGDPLGMGVGGPGYTFDDEIAPDLTMKPGVLAMANAGKDDQGGGTNGSQFFITEIGPEWLNGKHTIFGQCKEVDLVKKITSVPRDPQDHPNTPVVIKKVTISRG